MDDKRASRISLYHPLDLDDEQQRQEAEEWAVTTLIAMYDALNEPLRSAANTVRASAITREDFADVPTREVPLP
ncbi:hypothetical protein [Rhodococcus aetherivorans]|uniref:hypothetical protein n=1 Tax=Rhodococcus aetherivorans TaxID=191292 RepID=UPI003F61097C